jgi:hypothetical protein
MFSNYTPWAAARFMMAPKIEDLNTTPVAQRVNFVAKRLQMIEWRAANLILTEHKRTNALVTENEELKQRVIELERNQEHLQDTLIAKELELEEQLEENDRKIDRLEQIVDMLVTNDRRHNTALRVYAPEDRIVTAAGNAHSSVIARVRRVFGY